ncbi:MAG: DUF1566 domain-containing protein, partial [Candidatus Obscuribacterales bacterium]|nr:DUF1566 domain-containing protein [Candidatus Obscuribacterales bacterium]
MKQITRISVLLAALLAVVSVCHSQTVTEGRNLRTATPHLSKDSLQRQREGAVERPRQRTSSFRVVDTGQDLCYGNSNSIAYPQPQEPFYGQDAQYQAIPFAFRDNRNGTVTDLNTGLMWEKTPDFVKRNMEEAESHARHLNLGGYSDWRIPSIKELFSIANFSGSIQTMTPYIDTRVFDFEYPDTSKGWRIIDAQYRSSTRYLGITMAGDSAGFGFNFADGRIKGYPISGPGARRFGAGKQYLRCVRGPTYGVNYFVDNNNGTISDRATDLMWTKSDTSSPMNWQQALDYAERLKYAGYSDWRLPNIKELQSIVDYRRTPDAQQVSARGPAIDPIFKVTKEESWCWSSTTHLDNQFGYYVCFGQALSARKWRDKQMNAHGAGAVRSDPKAGNPADWPNGLGPQSDEIRIYNYVRCVRGGVATLRTAPPASSLRRIQRRKPTITLPSAGKRWVLHLDKNKDGKVARSEFDGPPQHFSSFDKNGDGFITESEAPSGPPPGGG